MTGMPLHHPGRRARQRGAALLIAMVLLTVVATLAAGMVWTQWRATQVEAAERGRTQSAWILAGALDWARLILREDAIVNRGKNVDHLAEPWAVPLAEARLSTFLAADAENNADGGPDAFLAGSITDLQARYNLRNLIDGGKIVPAEQAGLERLCSAIGLPSDLAGRIAQGLLDAQTGAAAAPLEPRTVDDLAWLGVDAASIAKLRDMVGLLPQPTPVNINTAPREVIVAAIDGIDLGSAEGLVRRRQNQPFEDLGQVKAMLPATVVLEARRINVNSSHFEVRGRMRLEDRTLEDVSIVERRGQGSGQEVVPLSRRRVLEPMLR